MGLLGSARGVGEIWKIIRELDLTELQEAADRPIRLLVTGDAGPAGVLATTLSQRPGSSGIHPWISLLALPLGPDEPEFRPDVALVATAAADHGHEAQAAIRQLVRRGVPVITLVTGEDALQRTGAELPREGEAARALVPDPAMPVTTAKALFGPLIEAFSPEHRSDALLALGRHFPTFRDLAIAELVEETSRANAIFAATTGIGEIVPGLNLPLIIGDTVILTKNQLLMAYKIALIAGKQGDPRTLMGEIVSVIGGGLVARQIARELVGLIPVIGIVPKVIVAYTGTRVIGAIAHVWSVEDRRPNAEEVRQMYKAALERGKATAKQLTDRRKKRRERKALTAGSEAPAEAGL